MKRISSILAIALVLFAGIIIAVSADEQGDGNSTIPNSTATPDIPTSNVSDTDNETNVTIPVNNTSNNQSNVTNGTNVTVPTNETSGNLSNVTNVTNVTVAPKPTNVTVLPKTTTGKIIPAPVSTKKTVIISKNINVDKATAIKPAEVKNTDINNEGVQITALHPLSGGEEYVSITNFNDFTAHLEGYKIHETKCNNTIIFHDIDVLPGHTLKVYTGSHPDGPDVVGTHKLHHIYNQHDKVELICACKNVISVFEK